MRGGEAANLVVGEAGGFASGDDVEFADILAALGIDYPDRTILHDGFAQRRETSEVSLPFGGKKYQIDICDGLGFREFGFEGLDIVDELTFGDAENQDFVADLDAELVQQRAMGIVALRWTRL